jgi:hypothetical protein
MGIIIAAITSNDDRLRIAVARSLEDELLSESWPWVDDPARPWFIENERTNA